MPSPTKEQARSMARDSCSAESITSADSSSWPCPLEAVNERGLGFEAQAQRLSFKTHLHLESETVSMGI